MGCADRIWGLEADVNSLTELLNEARMEADQLEEDIKQRDAELRDANYKLRLLVPAQAAEASYESFMAAVEAYNRGDMRLSVLFARQAATFKYIAEHGLSEKVLGMLETQETEIDAIMTASIALN